MKTLFKWVFYGLDIMDQIVIKRSLRRYIDAEKDPKEEGQEMLKGYANDLLKTLNKGQLAKF